MSDATETDAMIASAPNDIDLERTLLAAVIADNAVLDRLVRLEPEMFYDPIHAAVFAAAMDLKKDNRPVNLVTLKPRFGAVPFATGGTVFEYLKTFEFAGNLPSVTDVSDSLVELHLRREVQSLGDRISGSVWDQGVGPNTILTDMSREIDLLLARTRPVGVTQRYMSDAVDDVLDGMLNDGKADCILTGLTDFDAATGGLRRGEYTLLAGRPSMGKSAIAVCLARRMALSGFGVAVFSLEMTSRQWTSRTICDEVWDHQHRLEYRNAIRNSFSDADFDLFTEGARRISKLPIVIEEQSGLSVADIASRTRQIAQRMMNERGVTLGAVIVDHIGKIKASNRYKGNTVKEVGETSAGLFHLGKSEKVAMLALAQLNRGVEGRENKRPSLPDLRDSGDLEQDADMVLFPYRPAYYLERMKEDDIEKEVSRLSELERVKNVMELQIAKQRNGPTKTIDLFADIASNAVRDSAKFDNIIPIHQPPRKEKFNGTIYSASDRE